MSTERLTIVCLSSQRWDDGMWTNKQHVMSRLAKQHRVLHVNFGSLSPSKWVRSRLAEGLRLRGVVSRPVRQVVEGVEVLDFPRVLPGVSLLPRHNPVRIWADFDERIVRLHRFLEEEGIDDPVIWVYHPGYGDVSHLPHRLMVYDCVDEYTAFPNYAKHPEWLREREATLCRAADLVFTTAPALFETKRPLNPEHTHLVHNVGDAEHFATALDETTAVPKDMADIPAPRLCFVGAVSAYKVHVDWLVHLAEIRPDWHLVMIGPLGLSDPSTDVRRLVDMPNVHLLGHRAYAELPAYLKGADVCLIPYAINDYTRHVFPIKFFEMMATGKPVVISNLPALEEFYDAVEVASNADEFVERCEHALNAGEALRSKRCELAEQNSWPVRVRKLMDLVQARLEE